MIAEEERAYYESLSLTQKTLFNIIKIAFVVGGTFLLSFFILLGGGFLGKLAFYLLEGPQCNSNYNSSPKVSCGRQ
jgi:hypothetical protein